MSIIQENADTLRAFVLDTPGSEARDNVEKLRRFDGVSLTFYPQSQQVYVYDGNVIIPDTSTILTQI